MHSPSRSRAHSRSRASSRETSQRPRASSRETSQRPRGLSSPRERRPHGFSWPREHEISMSNVDFHLDAEEDSQVHSGQEQKLLADDQARLSIIGEEQLMSKFNIPEGYTLIDSRPYEWAPPADVASHPYKEHQGEGSQYLRDFILGINDGLISTLLLVVGMVGGGADSRAILLAAISAAIAGAIAMGLGEWIATKSQNDVVTGEMRLEKEHFKYHRGQEIDQLRTHLKTVGLDGPLLEACVRQIASNDTYLMKIMERFEFGAENNEDNELTRSPVVAMFMSGRLFFLGALPSTLPFIQSSPELGLLLSCLACGITLFGVGVYKTRTTGGNPWYGGFENFMAGALGAGISFCVGLAYNAIRSA